MSNNGQDQQDELLHLVQTCLPDLTSSALSRNDTIPQLAKDEGRVAKLRDGLYRVPTSHRLVRGDARDLAFIEAETVHLVVTSPPYWTLKQYNHHALQMGEIEDYDTFNAELQKVWQECHRVLVPGGRLVIVVGDVCLSRRQYGRHLVMPLHATIQECCRQVGFDNLAPIIWYKIANANYEAGGGGFLGKPYEPNAIIKNDVEYILMQRKPGGYRKPTKGMRALSIISANEHREWFQQIWHITGASTRDHPAPYPIDLADRLVRMFSFVGDTVLDPFSGTGTTLMACIQSARNSINVDIDEDYLHLAYQRFMTSPLAMLYNTQVVYDGVKTY